MSSYPTKQEYDQKCQAYKAAREQADGIWKLAFKDPDSLNKLTILQNLLKAIHQESTHRAYAWNPTWGPQDKGHTDFRTKLEDWKQSLLGKEAEMQGKLLAQGFTGPQLQPDFGYN